MINYDFSTPQRQSLAGIIVMAAHYIQQVVRATIIPIVLFLVKAETRALSYFVIIFAVIIVLVLFFSYLSYKRFTFYLDDEKQEFIINKGIFNRTLLTIQLEKIQQVTINQSFLQKLIGVYSLQIDTPGGDRKEVSIKAIDEKIAYCLKEHLLNGRNTFATDLAEDAEIAPKERSIFLKLSMNTLFKVGLTSNYGSSLALLIGFGYAIFHNAKELLRAFDSDDGQVEAAIRSGVTLFSIGILIALFLVVLFIINIIRTFMKYYDFEISKHKLSLLISSGLLARRNTLLSPKKVQITAYSQNYFQKKFNLLNLNLKQAHSGEAQNEKDLQKANLEVPGCSAAEKDELLVLILGKIPTQEVSFFPNYRFLNLPIFFITIIPISIFYIVWFNINELRPYYPLSIIYFFTSIFMIYMSYKRHKIAVSEDFIIKTSGIWDISKEIIVPHKIQTITTFQYPWHKGVDVGHVNLHTAAGIIHFKYGDYTEIKQLVNYWLYQIESGSDDWM